MGYLADVGDMGMAAVVRIVMFVVAIAMVGVVTVAMRNRPKSDRPPTAVSGRRGPLLVIGLVGAVAALLGQYSDWPEDLKIRLGMAGVGLAIALGGFLGWAILRRAGID